MVELEALERSLRERAGSVDVFLRDDDGGWDHDALERLLRPVLATGVALDLAVIPAAVDERAKTLIATLQDEAEGRLHVHQHGRAHVNHEPSGKKCEFGGARSFAAQRADIEYGAARLRAAFGAAVEPVFTPPWNRCNEDTARALASAGFTILSRESEAEPFGAAGLAEVPVHVDWLKKRAGVRLTGPAFADYLAQPFRANAFVGLMLHHAAMTAEDCADVLAVLDVLRVSSKVRFTSIRALAERRCVQ